MESINKLKQIFFSEPIEETTPLPPTELISNRVKNFNVEGFKQSGHHQGNANSLKTFFHRISNGHMTDLDGSEVNKRQQAMQEKCCAKEAELSGLQSKLKNLNEVELVSAEKKIEDLKNEILQIKIELENKKIDGGYSKFTHYMYGTLVSILTVYLVLFYASCIYSSFFRNAESLINNAGSDIQMVINSIFDVNGIFIASPCLLICYLGAFIFFGIGLMPHIIARKVSKYKNIKIALVVFAAFLIECGIAFRIDSSIHDLKVMAGIADSGWVFYKSINFYMVLAFGFIAYLVWGFLMEAMLAEKEKTNMDRIAKLQIAPIKEKIEKATSDLEVLKTGIIEQEGKITIAEIELKKLKSDVEKGIFTPEELAKNLEDFYLGWREYAIRSNYGGEHLAELSNTYESTKNEFFKTTLEIAA